MRMRKFNTEVLYADESIIKIDSRDIALLKKQSDNNERKRIRLCTHLDVKDTLHEMFIVHKEETYVRPHKHLNKAESLHIIEGAVDIILFDEAGQVAEVIYMGDYLSGKQFYYRISEPYYHTLLIKTEYVIFHETTTGPFNRLDTIFAPWSPDESEPGEVKMFMNQLAKIAEDLYSL